MEGPPPPGPRLLGFGLRKWSERSGHCGSALSLCKQMLYMCVNKTDRHYLFFIFLLHRCVPGLSSPLATLQSAAPGPCGGGRCGCPVWQVDSGGVPGAQRSLDGGGRCRVPPLPGPPRASAPRCLQLPRSYTLNVNQAATQQGGRAPVKAKDPWRPQRVGRRWPSPSQPPPALCPRLPSSLLLLRLPLRKACPCPWLLRNLKTSC